MHEKINSFKENDDDEEEEEEWENVELFNNVKLKWKFRKFSSICKCVC